MATKSRNPNLLGVEGADKGSKVGAVGESGSGSGAASASFIPPASTAPPPAADPFSPKDAPVALRSSQLLAPIEGEFPEGLSATRITKLLQQLGAMDTVALPTAETLLQHTQMRKEAAAFLALSKAVEAEEEAVV